MNYKDLMKLKGYHLSLEQISERRMKDVRLRIIVNASDNITDLLIFPHGDSNVTTYQIDFSHYITYSVISDDYTVWNEAEIFQGGSFRFYDRSNYFEFIQKESVLRDKECVHYPLVCHEHKVDVISHVEPIISEIDVRKDQN